MKIGMAGSGAGGVDRAVGWAGVDSGREEKLSGESFSLPPPNLPSPSSKTFVLIESPSQDGSLFEWTEPLY